MAWRIVKQPGHHGAKQPVSETRYARFSDIVDDFTHLNMTYDEALSLCQKALGVGGSIDKMKAADADTVWGAQPTTRDGLARWRDCMKTIWMMHWRRTPTFRQPLKVWTKTRFAKKVRTVTTCTWPWGGEREH